jgi:O-antigen ligase
MERWGVLGLGALVGLIIILKERRHSFGTFHIVGLLAVLTALMSAAVSRYTSLSSLKVLSLFLLFLYAATGARLAVSGRESRFFTGLLVGCEVFVALIAGFHFAGGEVMGNPNSLGAVMGVVAAPILLWGTLLRQSSFSRWRQLLFFGLAMYLIFGSHARAGMAAALSGCSLLCLCLRRYMLLAKGVVIFAILLAGAAIFRPAALSGTVAWINSDVIYKGKDPAAGLLNSRESPWQEAMAAIHDHYWFGSGFGTSDTGLDPTETLGEFASNSRASREHGSSYLEIVAWVGLVGTLPFLLLLGMLLGQILKTLAWMFRTANPSHPAVPLAIMLLTGLVHAAFEDWLFAPGYYLCVFFWSMAFIFVDQVKLLAQSDTSSVPSTRSRLISPQLRTVVPGR